MPFAARFCRKDPARPFGRAGFSVGWGYERSVTAAAVLRAQSGLHGRIGTSKGARISRPGDAGEQKSKRKEAKRNARHYGFSIARSDVATLHQGPQASPFKDVLVTPA